MLTNSRDCDVIKSTFRFRYIFCNYRKSYCTPSIAVRGSASDVTSPTMHGCAV